MTTAGTPDDESEPVTTGHGNVAFGAHALTQTTTGSQSCGHGPGATRDVKDEGPGS